MIAATMFIYKITNKINGKIYIGKTKDFQKRWKRHISNAKAGRVSALYNAIRKHGIDNFYIEPIICVIDISATDILEKEIIKAYGSRNRNVGYNIREGGDGGGDATVFRMFAAARKGKTAQEIFGKEKAKNISIKRSISLIGKTKGRTKSIEEKQKISITLRTKWDTDEKYRVRMTEINRNKAKHGKNHPMFGRTHSEEAKKLISAAQKGRMHSDEWKQNMSKRMLENNPTSKESSIDIRLCIKMMIDDPSATIISIAKTFDTSNVTLSKYLRKFLGVGNVQKFRAQIGSSEEWKIFLEGKLLQ